MKRTNRGPVSRRLRGRRAAFAVVLVAASLVGVGAWVLVRPMGAPSALAAPGGAESMAMLLHSLEEEDAGWNVDVLSAGIGLEENYDDIAARKTRIDADFNSLGARAARDKDARSRVEMLRKVFDDKSDAVETFKSHQSVLRNSLRYVSTAADEARGLLDADSRADPKSRDGLRALLDAASSHALRYAVAGDQDQHSRLAAATQSLDEAVARVPDASPAKPQLLIVLNHLQTVLHQKPDVDALLRTIVDAPTRKMIEDVEGQLTK